jgi:penicillin-binding protein 1C
METVWVDARLGKRLQPGCAAKAIISQPIAAGGLQTVQYPRWPTLLEPWIGPAERSPVELLPLDVACRVQAPNRQLRVTGIDAGSVIRPPPGRQHASVQVQAMGSADTVQWLLDGQWVGSTTARASGLRLRLSHAGEHTLTAMDQQGRYDQVRFTVN